MDEQNVDCQESIFSEREMGFTILRNPLVMNRLHGYRYIKFSRSQNEYPNHSGAAFVFNRLFICSHPRMKSPPTKSKCRFTAIKRRQELI